MALSSITATRIETHVIRFTSLLLGTATPFEIRLYVAIEGDIRNCSSHSLLSLSLPQPRLSKGYDKRRLLLIYIYGFIGEEASFHDLPTHLYDLLTGILSESYIIYTRIYPRYKSYGELRTMVDQFSN